MADFIIFDRDGTLIEFQHYLVDPELIKIHDETISGLHALRMSEFRFGIISNQSIVGRGIASVTQVNSVNNEMLKKFASFGIEFEFLYFCPHAPYDSCNCRKPKIALGLKAIREYQINVKNSYMIGDMDLDIVFGNSLGLNTIKISSDYSNIADFTAQDILKAALWIIGD
jgi:D-glycero-D-manno-heptose 1,7-bisphosphate phosphatase